PPAGNSDWFIKVRAATDDKKVRSRLRKDCPQAARAKISDDKSLKWGFGHKGRRRQDSADDLPSTDAAELYVLGRSLTGPRAASLMHPFKNGLAQILGRAAISLALGALRWRSIVALCGSIIIRPRSMPAASIGSSIASKPRSLWWASQSAMPLPVLRIAFS